MVRPIEISDVLSKVPAAERMQQSTRAVPEAAQQFQKELGEKLAGEQVTTTQPAPSGDRVILHAEEREKDPREHQGHRKDDHSEPPESPSTGNAPDPDQPAAPGHIDIRV